MAKASHRLEVRRSRWRNQSFKVGKISGASLGPREGTEDISLGARSNAGASGVPGMGGMDLGEGHAVNLGKRMPSASARRR